MPQTLLAISAIVITGFLTLSQGDVSRRTTDSVVKDQFELAVAGTLLHTMEFVDSRAFDEVTTPENLRQRMGLPDVMTRAERDTISFDDLTWIRPNDFATVSNFGGGGCNIENPRQALSCDDVDDVADGEWHSLDLETPDGDSMPVEVKVDITYVDAAAGEEIDTPVSDRTYHKRIEVYARSNQAHQFGGGRGPVEVSLRRVISFDPEVAAEYLRRSIRVSDDDTGTCSAETNEWNIRMEQLQNTLEDAQGAERSAILRQADAQSALAAAQSAVATAVAQQSTADDAYDAADDAADARDAAAQRARDTRDNAVSAAQQANRARDAAQSDAQSAAAGLSSAQEAATQTAAERDETQATLDATLADYYDAYDDFDTARDNYTYVSNGRRYFRSSATQAQRNEYYARAAEVNEIVDRYYGERDERDEAREDATRAASALEDARAAADDAAARSTATTTAATAAADALAGAESGVNSAADAARGARAAADAARDSARAYGEATDAARDRAATAQGALDAADADVIAARAQTASAQQAVNDHEASRPNCAA